MDVQFTSVVLLGIVVAAVFAHQAPSIPGVPPNMHQQNQMGVHGHTHQQDNFQRRQGQPPHSHHSYKEGAKDRDHVLDHLDGMVNQDRKDLSHMTDDEIQFHYFKLHDYDDNSMLDGLELVSALTHYHKDEDPDNKPLSEKELQTLVDTILKEDDRNDDGYVDYAEFIVSQRT